MVRPWVRGAACLLLATLLVPLLAGALRELPGTPTGSAAPGATPSLDLVGVTLALSPATWTMFPAQTIDLVASAADVPAGCALFDAWVRWSLPGVSFDRGYLNRSTGLAVAFTSLPNASGPVTVAAESTLVLTCDDGSSADVSTDASALIRVLAPLSVGGFSASPSLVRPGDAIDLGWNLSGGAPPYALTLDFGDGNRSALLQGGPGPGAALHAYATGAFVPSLSVRDGRGSVVNLTVAVPVRCAAGLSVSLDPPGAPAEVGRSFALNATVAGGSGPVRATWIVNGSPVAGTSVGGLLHLSIRPSAAGPLPVNLTIRDDVGDVAAANATYPVAAPPTLRIADRGVAADVGRPVLLNASLEGGVGPYAVSVRIVGSNGSANLTATSAGPFPIVLVPSAPGPLLVAGAIRDAAGGATTTTGVFGSVGWPPEASLLPPALTLEAGRPLPIGLRIDGGVAPFQWSIRATPGLAGGALPTGVGSSEGTVEWNGTPNLPGNLSLAAVVVDGVGGVAEANLTLPVLPALRLSVAIDNWSDPGSVVVYAHVTGGAAPYSVRASLGALAASAFNLSGAGDAELRLSGTPAGFGVLRVAAVDAAGVTADSDLSILVAPWAESRPAPASPAPGGAQPPVPGWGIVVAVAVVASGAYAGFRMLRRSRPVRSAPVAAGRALEWVRRSVKGSDGIDEETLRLLAEEEGIDPSTVGPALDRWVRLGRVRRTVDPSGAPALTWVSPRDTGEDPNVAEEGFG